MKVNDHSTIVKVVVKDFLSGKEWNLLEKKNNNRCHFFEIIEHNKKWIQLRLDWNNNFSKEPVLDANIYSSPDLGKENEIEKEKWHHTKKEYDSQSGKCIYIFTYESLELNLEIKITKQEFINCCSNIVK